MRKEFDLITMLSTRSTEYGVTQLSLYVQQRSRENGVLCRPWSDVRKHLRLTISVWNDGMTYACIAADDAPSCAKEATDMAQALRLFEKNYDQTERIGLPDNLESELSGKMRCIGIGISAWLSTVKPKWYGWGTDVNDLALAEDKCYDPASLIFFCLEWTAKQIAKRTMER